jgi:hypothetical protein
MNTAAYPDIADSEILGIERVLATLNREAADKSHNFEAFEREIRERFQDIGFVVTVSWYEFGRQGQVGAVPNAAMPEITIVDRCERKPFDHDRQVHEVTNNILGLPGQEGVIRTSTPGMKRLVEGHKHGRAN